MRTIGPEGQYIGWDQCPHCGHRLNHAMPVEEDVPVVDPNSHDARIGFCNYCSEMIMYSNGRLQTVPDNIIEYIKKDNPEFYNQLVEAQKILKDIENGRV